MSEKGGGIWWLHGETSQAHVGTTATRQRAREEVLVGLAHRKAPIHLLGGPNSKEDHEG